jgi:hypothetical protein
MPAQSLPPRKRGAGIQKLRRNSLDSRFRGNDVGGLRPNSLSGREFRSSGSDNDCQDQKNGSNKFSYYADESNPARLSKALLV